MDDIIHELKPKIDDLVLEHEEIMLHLSPDPCSIKKAIHAFSSEMRSFAGRSLEEIAHVLESNNLGVILATGGLARGEMSSRTSDIDLSLIEIEELPAEVVEKLRLYPAILGGIFGDRYKNSILSVSLYGLETLDSRRWNELADLKPIYGTKHFDSVRETIAETYEPRKKIKNLLGERGKHQTSFSSQSLEQFNTKDGVGGLRDLQYALWISGVEQFQSIGDQYKTLPPELHDAYWFIHLARTFSNISNDTDVLGIDEFKAFRQQYGTDAFENVIAARRRIMGYSKGVIERALSEGLEVSEDVYANSRGLYTRKNDPQSVLKLFTFAQEIGMDIGYGEATNISANFQPSKDYISLFGIPGSFYNTLRCIELYGFLNQLITTSRLESEIEPNMKQTKLETALERIRISESYEDEFPISDQSTRTALAIALVTRDFTDDEVRSFHNQYEIVGEVKETLDFLREHGTFFLTNSRDSVNNHLARQSLDTIIRKSSDVALLARFSLSLYEELGNQEHLINNINELYRKVHGFATSHESVLQQMPDEYREVYVALPDQFMTSRYADQALSIVPKVLSVKQKGPKIDHIERKVNTVTYRVICEDYPGLFPVIAGALKQRGDFVSFATYTLSTQPRMALDYITLSEPPSDFEGVLKEAIVNRVHVPADEEVLKNAFGYDLTFTRHWLGMNQFTLKAKATQEVPGITHALSESLYQLFNSNIFCIMRSVLPRRNECRYVIHFETQTDGPSLQQWVYDLPKNNV